MHISTHHWAALLHTLSPFISYVCKSKIGDSGRGGGDCFRNKRAKQINHNPAQIISTNSISSGGSWQILSGKACPGRGSYSVGLLGTRLCLVDTQDRHRDRERKKKRRLSASHHTLATSVTLHSQPIILSPLAFCALAYTATSTHPYSAMSTENHNHCQDPVPSHPHFPLLKARYPGLVTNYPFLVLRSVGSAGVGKRYSPPD